MKNYFNYKFVLEKVILQLREDLRVTLIMRHEKNDNTNERMKKKTAHFTFIECLIQIMLFVSPNLDCPMLAP